MYSLTDERIKLLEEKLKITERLLEIEKRQHEVTQVQLKCAKESHRLQQVNTGVFFESTKAAEAKLEQIRAVIESDEESREKVGDIRRLLNG